ncbi:MAG: phage major capsid protein [Armatimonadetes bacterium]|nr:phage major capsid protein [Armatimonadota bacterium]
MPDTAEHLRSPIQKANEFTTTVLTNGKGDMLPSKADQFFQIAIVNPVLMSQVDVQLMREPEMQVPKMGWTDQILQPATEGQALGSGAQARPDLSYVSITTQKYMGEVPVTNEVFEDNVEAAGLANTLERRIAEKVGQEMEIALIKGDTSSLNPFLAKQDGILVQATSNTVNNSGATLDMDGLKDAKRALPLQYPRDARTRKFYTSVDAWEDYAEWWEERIGDSADKHATDYVAAPARGTEVVQVPLWPQDYGGANTTAVLFMEPKNVLVRIHRAVKVKVIPDERADSVVFLVSLRYGFKYLHEDAVVKLYNVGIST